MLKDNPIIRNSREKDSLISGGPLMAFLLVSGRPPEQENKRDA
jgi:hypothetical protein